MKLKRTTSKEVSIGDYRFRIRPLPAMDATYIFGDVTAMVLPVLATVGVKDENKDILESNLLENVDLSTDSLSSALAKINGRQMVTLANELLMEHSNVSLYDDDTEQWSPITKDDFNEVFCQYLAGEFKLCAEVLIQNYGSFFSDLGTLFGGVIKSLKSKASQSTETSTENS